MKKNEAQYIEIIIGLFLIILGTVIHRWSKKTSMGYGISTASLKANN